VGAHNHPAEVHLVAVADPAALVLRFGSVPLLTART
jgi:hypothetical protein